MIERKYKCDLCGDPEEPRKLVGLYWDGMGIVERDPVTVETHICFYCLSSLQNFEKRCGKGFKCSGGPNCDFDHK
jgi:hypothetical protein